MCILFTCYFFHLPGKAQQMIIDDAVTTTPHTFQIESWYGTHESWLIPAFGLNSYLEVATGMVFNSPESMSLSGWMLEAKTVNRDMEIGHDALGLVSGIVWGSNMHVQEMYAYIPYSCHIMKSHSVLHVNAGWAMHNEAGSSEQKHVIAYGVRADWGISDNIFILSEVYLENFDLTVFHGGVRLVLIPDLMESDITYGRGLASDMEEPGFSFGVAITPGPLW